MAAGRLANRLYTGEVSVDFVGRARRWYLVSAVVLALALAGIGLRELNLGVEFTGGAVFTAPAASTGADTVTSVRAAASGVGASGAQEPRVTAVGDDRVDVQTGELSTTESTAVRDAIAQVLDTDPGSVAVQVVGPSWGAEITRQAGVGLLFFLAALVVYLSLAFEWRMAVAALAALLHDVVATVGVYAWTGFVVTPATVIGLLTILGYSLYDTVVVFDKVKENTKGITGQSRLTYSEAANLAVNQTLVRSVNTSVIALLPVAAVLFVGAGVLGAGTLKDFALVLFVGMAVGTYSSIFIATPVLAGLKEREPTLRGLAARVETRRRQAAGGPTRQPAPGAPAPPTTAVGGPRPPAAAPRRAVETGERHQPQRRTRAQRRDGKGSR